MASCRASSVSTCRKLAIVAAGLAVSLASTSASAQSAACGEIQPMLVQRKAISDRLSAASKGKQIEARVACSGFGQLVTNGQGLIKWVDANKDWCQIPETFVEGIKADHGRSVTIRARACSFATKQAQAEKRAKEGGSAPGGLLGGNGLAGESRLPQGAL